MAPDRTVSWFRKVLTHQVQQHLFLGVGLPLPHAGDPLSSLPPASSLALLSPLHLSEAWRQCDIKFCCICDPVAFVALSSAFAAPFCALWRLCMLCSGSFRTMPAVMLRAWRAEPEPCTALFVQYRPAAWTSIADQHKGTIKDSVFGLSLKPASRSGVSLQLCDRSPLRPCSPLLMKARSPDSC